MKEREESNLKPATSAVLLIAPPPLLRPPRTRLTRLGLKKCANITGARRYHLTKTNEDKK